MEGQGGSEGQLWEICLKQPPKLVQEQLQPVLVGVWGVGDALAHGSSTQHHAGLCCQPRQEQGDTGREDAAAAAPPAGIFFAFPNGSFLRQPPPPTAGSTWLQCWLGICRRLCLGGQGLPCGTAVMGGDPTHPWGRGHGLGWQRLRELDWARQQPLLEATPTVPHDPDSPGTLYLWGSSDPSLPVGCWQQQNTRCLGFCLPVLGLPVPPVTGYPVPVPCCQAGLSRDQGKDIPPSHVLASPDGAPE